MIDQRRGAGISLLQRFPIVNKERIRSFLCRGPKGTVLKLVFPFSIWIQKYFHFRFSDGQLCYIFRKIWIVYRLLIFPCPFFFFFFFFSGGFNNVLRGLFDPSFLMWFQFPKLPSLLVSSARSMLSFSNIQHLRMFRHRWSLVPSNTSSFHVLLQQTFLFYCDPTSERLREIIPHADFLTSKVLIFTLIFNYTENIVDSVIDLTFLLVIIFLLLATIPCLSNYCLICIVGLLSEIRVYWISVPNALS